MTQTYRPTSSILKDISDIQQQKPPLYLESARDSLASFGTSARDSLASFGASAFSVATGFANSTFGLVGQTLSGISKLAKKNTATTTIGSGNTISQSAVTSIAGDAVVNINTDQAKNAIKTYFGNLQYNVSTSNDIGYLTEVQKELKNPNSDFNKKLM